LLTNKDTWILILTGLITSIIFTSTYLLQLRTFMYVIFPLLVGLLFVLSYNGRNISELLGSSFFVALLLSIPFRGYEIWGSESTRHINLLICYPILVYVTHCFHYIYHHNGGHWNVSYTLFFEALWNTLIVLLFGTLFMYSSENLILYPSFLYDGIYSSFLYNRVSTNGVFSYFLGLFLLFLGIGIAQYNIKVLHQLRFILRTCMYYFLPLLVLASVTFFILFLQNTAQNPNIIISAFFDLTLVSILFLNAYYQYDNNEKKQIAWLNGLLRGYKVFLLIMILITNYYAYRYMSLEFNQLIYLTIALFLGGIYAYSAFRSDKEAQQIMEKGNKYLAIVFMVALYIAILPPFDFIVNKDKSPLSIWDGTDYIRKSTYQKS